jgi:hypothetical protein
MFDKNAITFSGSVKVVKEHTYNYSFGVALPGSEKFLWLSVKKPYGDKKMSFDVNTAKDKMCTFVGAQMDSYDKDGKTVYNVSVKDTDIVLGADVGVNIVILMGKVLKINPENTKVVEVEMAYYGKDKEKKSVLKHRRCHAQIPAEVDANSIKDREVLIIGALRVNPSNGNPFVEAKKLTVL